MSGRGGGGMGVFVALLVVGVADEVLSHLNVVAFVLMGFTQSPAFTTHRTQYARLWHSSSHPLTHSLVPHWHIAMRLTCAADGDVVHWITHKLLELFTKLLWTSFWSIAIWKVPDRIQARQGDAKDWQSRWASGQADRGEKGERKGLNS